jgi:hypothetical protein
VEEEEEEEHPFPEGGGKITSPFRTILEMPTGADGAADVVAVGNMLDGRRFIPPPSVTSFSRNASNLGFGFVVVAVVDDDDDDNDVVVLLSDNDEEDFSTVAAAAAEEKLRFVAEGNNTDEDIVSPLLRLVRMDRATTKNGCDRVN